MANTPIAVTRELAENLRITRPPLQSTIFENPHLEQTYGQFRTSPLSLTELYNGPPFALWAVDDRIQPMLILLPLEDR